MTKRVRYVNHMFFKKMPEYHIIIGVVAGIVAIFTGAWAAFRFIFRHPALDLVYIFCRNEQRGSAVGRILLSIHNSGWVAARNVFVELRVIAPKSTYVNRSGLFLYPDKGVLEGIPKRSMFDLSNSKPTVIQYRLKPHIFINRKALLEVGYFIVTTYEDMPPEKLYHELEWTIHCAEEQPRSGIIVLDGLWIKRQLLRNLQERLPGGSK